MTAILIAVSSFNPRWLDVIISPYADWKSLPLRGAFLLGSFIISILLILEFKYKRTWANNRWAKTGSDTLFFYLFHPYILYVVVILWKNHIGSINMLAAIAITLLTMAVLFLLSNIKLLHNIIR